MISLLDADPELGAELTPEQLIAARRLALPKAVLAPGPWTIEQLDQVGGVRGAIRAFLVLTGAVTIDLEIGNHACTRLITSGELVLLPGAGEDSIPIRTGWTALQQTALVILDDRLLVIAAGWPALMAAILKRAAEQIRHALLQQAISQLPRVEDRLLALMWSIADRRGIVRPDGVWVSLPVTHATLARMIGARRPTVSLGLKSLQDQRLLVPHDDGWLLAQDSARAFPHPVAQ